MLYRIVLICKVSSNVVAMMGKVLVSLKTVEILGFPLS